MYKISFVKSDGSIEMVETEELSIVINGSDDFKALKDYNKFDDDIEFVVKCFDNIYPIGKAEFVLVDGILLRDILLQSSNLPSVIENHRNIAAARVAAESLKKEFDNLPLKETDEDDKPPINEEGES